MKKYLNYVPTFLFSVYVPLSLYANNINEVSFSQVFPTLAVILLINLIVLLFLILINKAFVIRTIPIICIIWLLFFFYQPLYYQLSSLLNIRHLFYILFVLLLIASLFFFSLRLKHQTVLSLNFIFFVMSVGLLSIPCITILKETYAQIKKPYVLNDKILTKDFNTDIVNDKPDVYYIILDAYAGEEVLNRYFEFDNLKLKEYLQNKDFYLAIDSYANYPTTHLSLASTLNLDYLNNVFKELPNEKLNKLPYFNLIHDSLFSSILKSIGYETYFITTSSYMQPRIEANNIDNKFIYSRWNDYLEKLYSFTPLRYLYKLGIKNLDKHFKLEFTGDRGSWIPNSTDWAVNKVISIADSGTKPKFIFAHILSPHIPFYYNSNCEVDRDKLKQNWLSEKTEFEEYKEAYILEINCLNIKVIRLLDALLKNENNKIIIIQGDHGPSGIYDHNLKKVIPEINLNQYRFNILNTYYVPDEMKNRLYGSISPVNTFRVILGGILGKDIELVEDKSYWIKDGEHIPAFQ